MPPKKSAKPRPRARNRPLQPLSAERVISAALAIIDAEGISAMSMRTVAAKLGVEAMSLYRHVSSREELLLGVADRVLSEIEIPPPGTGWREAMRRRALSARETFLRHPSAALVVGSCAAMTPARLDYSNAILGMLIADGFDAQLAYRAFLLLDSYIYGFTAQELRWPRPSSPDALPPVAPVAPDRFPHFAAVMGEVKAVASARGPEPSHADEFGFGLELVLEALERSRGAASLASGTAPR